MHLYSWPLGLVSRKHNMTIEHSTEKQTDQCLVFPTAAWVTNLALDTASIQYCREIVEMLYLLECYFCLAHG